MFAFNRVVGVSLLAVFSFVVLTPSAEAVIHGLRTAPNGASSIFNGSFVSDNAFDAPSNPNAARWASSFVANDDEFIFVDLGADVKLNEITIDWETANATDYTIRLRTEAEGVSLNPADWSIIATRTGAAGLPGGGAQGDDDRFDFNSGSLTLQSAGGAGVVNTNEPVGRFLMVNATNDSTTCCDGYSIWELKVDAQPDGYVAIADPTVTFASSEFNASFTGDNLFDERIGGSDTDWAGVGPGPHFVDLDFGQAETIDGFNYTQRNNVGIPGADNVVQIDLFFSDTGLFGITPDVTITSVFQDLATHFYELGDTFNAQFVRFQIAGTQFNPGGAELDFFAKTVPEPTTGLLALLGVSALASRRRRHEA